MTPFGTVRGPLLEVAAGYWLLHPGERLRTSLFENPL